jgi:hypothetical protein
LLSRLDPKTTACSFLFGDGLGTPIVAGALAGTDSLTAPLSVR